MEIGDMLGPVSTVSMVNKSWKSLVSERGSRAEIRAESRVDEKSCK